MSGRNFGQMLQARWDEGKFVCVGLDSALESVLKVDHHLVRTAHMDHMKVTTFNKLIVDATENLVCAYKPNSAFYEALGSHGIVALEETMMYIHEVAPEVPVILDYKRGDIGSTNVGYVTAALHADAITLNPYLGRQANEPFLEQKSKGLLFLCRTSNPGAGEFQDLEVRSVGDYPTEPLYRRIARHIANNWNVNGNCGLVFGATYPEELAEGRRIAGDDIPFLVPGVGAQGGDLEASVKAAANSRGQGFILNSSRGIIFAGEGEDFAKKARAATQKMNDDITAALAA